MRGSFRLATLIFALPFTAGCLTTTALVKLRPDGSGTVEQTIMMNVKAIEMVGQMMGSAMGAEVSTERQTPARSFKDVFSEADFKKMAQQAGPGVRFVSSTPLMEGDKEGARIVFAFDDINKIQVDPMNVKPSGDRAAGKQDASFRLAKLPGGNSLLTIDMPDKSNEGADEQTPETGGQTAPQDVPPEMAAMIKQMFAGMRVALEVQVEGRLVRTNSPFAAGSRVTILDIDMDQLLQQENALKKLPKLGPGTNIAEAMAVLKGIQGLRVSPPPVAIEFR